MKLRILLPAFCILLIAFVEPARAQEKFVPGEIVTHQGDTLTGLLDYMSWSGAPTKMLFKQLPQGEVRVIKPLDVKSVRVKDLEYVGGIVDIEMSPHTVNNLDYHYNLSIATDTVFLMVVIGGPKSLYYIVNNNKELFYTKSGSVFELLVYKRYLKHEGDLKVIKEYKKYVGQLSTYLQNCPWVDSKLKVTKYKKADLKRLFRAYYDCVGVKDFKKKKGNRPALQISLIAGLSYTGLKFSGDPDVDHIVDAVHTKSTDFTGGIGVDLIFNKNRENWSLNNELIFSSFNVSGHHHDVIVENYYKILDTKLAMSYIKMNNLLRYKYPIGQMSLFFNIGISNGFGIVNENSRVERTVILTIDKEETGKAFDTIRPYEFGYVIGLGAKLKNFSLELRGENGTGFTESSAIQARASKLQFYLGYRIR